MPCSFLKKTVLLIFQQMSGIANARAQRLPRLVHGVTQFLFRLRITLEICCLEATFT